MISIYIHTDFYAEPSYTVGGWKAMTCWPKYFNFDQPKEIYTDLDQYQQSTADIKIAFNLIDHRTPGDLSQIGRASCRERV